MVIMLSKKINYICIIASRLPYAMWDCALQMTQFNEGEKYEWIRTSKIFEFENTKSYVKKCCDHWGERKTIYIRQIIYINQGHLAAKVTPAIDFTDEPVIQCEVPVVENTSAIRSLQKNDKNDK